MLEQEIASIIKFLLDKAENPSPYYHSVPKGFVVPAAYFPTPEITTGGDTLSTYSMSYTWFVLFFHKSSQEAYNIGLQVITEIRGKRNLIPLIDTKGREMKHFLRVDDPRLKVLDNGAAQLQIDWTSRRPYNSEQSEKMRNFEIKNWNNPDKYRSRTISAAYQEAISKYAIPFPNGAEQ